MALTWSPKQSELARAEELALSASLASSRPWIVSGLALSAGTGLNVAISAGVAWIDGYVVSWDASTEQAVTGSATNHVWVELTSDVNDNVTAVAFVINTTGTPPTGDYVKLGTATTNGSAVTGTATTGRSPQTQVLVSSVFGRDGAVVATAGDYDADQVDYDNATSGLSATDVQEAIDEIAARPQAQGFNDVYGKAANQTFNSGTTRATISDLVAALEANSAYCYEADFMVQNNSGSGVRLGATVPAGASGTISAFVMGNQNSGHGNMTYIAGGIAYNTNIDFSDTEINSTPNAIVKMIGYVATGGTAGNLTIQGARQAAAGSLVIRQGALLKVKKL
jgi:hypothetical protein